jgi:RNA polymerase sigma factor (sigma-70 family)
LGGKFPTTRLSALLGLGQPAPQRQRAWDALLASYWKPAYKHLRLNLRHGREDAEDLVQAFFARAFEKEFFAGYDPTRARFRTFLRMCLDRFVANEAKAQGRLKRGGGSTTVALDFDDAEQELARADLRAAAPDEIFDREWRRMLFALAIESLRAHCDATGRQTCFVVFERYDLCGPDERPTYPALADELGIPVTTVTNRLAYARRELRRCVRERLAEITADDEELEAETKVLFGRR